MKKTKLTRSLLAACSIVALSAVMYGCVHSGGDDGPVATDVTLSGAQMGQTLEAGRYQPDAALTTAIEGASDADLAAAAGEHAMGAMIKLAGLAFECVAGPCSVTVNDDDTVTTTGTIRVMAQMDTTGPTEPEPTAAEVTAGLFADAQNARSDAEVAGTEAAEAVKAATAAQEKLWPLNDAGDSMAEYTNAKAILDAKAAAAQAVTDAEAAKTAAETAKTAAEALDADNAHRASLIAALDAAIEVAEAQITAATTSNEREDLQEAVDAVTGGEDEDPQGTPASLAKAVAMAVGEALGGMASDSGIPRGDIAAADAVVPESAEMNDSVGKTWAGIVGDKAMESRVGATSAPVMIASIDGMTATDVQETGFDDGNFTDGGPVAEANYKGILGTAYCLSADCTVTDGKLEMGWYFAPTSATEVYVKQTTDNPETMDVDESKLYEPETLYAQFGHWLTVDADGLVTVNRYARIDAHATVATAADLSYLNEEGKPTSATFEGPAAGMSVHKTVDPDGVITRIYSGAFTADAELLLRFGDGADVTLGGTIDTFVTESEGMNVDPLWSVELERTTFTGGNLAGDLDNGKTVPDSPGRNGEWTATAYGPAAVDGDAQRPTGIFGGFNAHFSDGHAAGVYATR